MRGWQSSPPAPSHKAFPLLFPLATSAPNPLGYLHAQRGPWWGSVKFWGWTTQLSTRQGCREPQNHPVTVGVAWGPPRFTETFNPLINIPH